jgi:hypothetical protein
MHLARVYASAVDLPLPDRPYGAARATTDAEWRAMFKRFGVLPINYYSECVDPLVIPPNESPGIGDLADDLADIWQDLRGGLALYDAGHIGAAASGWRAAFDLHWGNHAAQALYVLQLWIGSQ